MLSARLNDHAAIRSSLIDMSRPFDVQLDSVPVSDVSGGSSSRLALRSRTNASSNNRLTTQPSSVSLQKSSSSSGGSAFPASRSNLQRNQSTGVDSFSYPFGQSTSSDFRSVIDDLTIENQKLKKKLNKLRSQQISQDSLFDVKINDLPPQKSAELLALLRTFVDSISEPAPAGTTPSSDKKDQAGTVDISDRAVDSTYASLSSADASTDCSSSQASRTAPHGFAAGLDSTIPAKRMDLKLPLTRDLAKMKSVVHRLEEVFKSAKPSLVEKKPEFVPPIPQKSESEETIDPRDFLPTTADAETQLSKTSSKPKRKKPANMDYLQTTSHLPMDEDMNEEHEWVYLNLLSNEAKLHEINVTPAFMRRSISALSRNLQLSPNGHRVRWRRPEEMSPVAEEYFPPTQMPQIIPPPPASIASSARSATQRRGVSRLAPVQYGSSSVPGDPSIRYTPMFLPPSPNDSTDSVASDDNESPESGDESKNLPIAFFKGRFFSDVTAADPGDIAEIYSGTGGIIGCSVSSSAPPLKRVSWRRMSPNSKYLFDSTSDDEEDNLSPFIIDTLPLSRDSEDETLDCFKPTGLARVEDHFTVTVSVKARRQRVRPRLRLRDLRTRVHGAFNHGRDDVSEPGSKRKHGQMSSSDEDRNRIVNVDFARHSPSRLPLTFYHQSSTSSEDVEMSS